MNTNIEEITEVFSLFHDGYIENYSIDHDTINLKIGIQYLAELISDKHVIVNLNLNGVNTFIFDAWTDESFVITEWTEILNLGIEIHSAELNSSGQILIHIRCDNAPANLFYGGKIILTCKSYTLTDQDNNKITLKKLKEISDYYWKEVFGKQNSNSQHIK